MQPLPISQAAVSRNDMSTATQTRASTGVMASRPTWPGLRNGRGASGSVLLTGSAQKSRVETPWRVSFDARGDQLALGVAELDRLLGAKPTLKAEASWQAGRLSVARSSLKGAAAEAELAGVMEASGALAFKSDWSANGPFRAGPVEITGRAKGTGSVGGTLLAPRLDLLADIEQIDLPRLSLKGGRLALVFQGRPDGSNGSVSIVANSDYGPATARSDFRFSPGGVDLMDLNVDAGGAKARGSLSLRSRAPSAVDLTVDVGPGAFLDAGRVTGMTKVLNQNGGLRAVMSLGAENLRARGSSISVRSAQLTADGPLDQLPYTLTARGASGQGAWTIKGRGQLQDLSSRYEITLDGQGTLGNRDDTTCLIHDFYRVARPVGGSRFGGDAARRNLADAVARNTAVCLGIDDDRELEPSRCAVPAGRSQRHRCLCNGRR